MIGFLKSGVLRQLDVRWYQITILSLFLIVGKLHLKFAIPWATVFACLLTVSLSDLFFRRFFRLPLEFPKSALISGLSLCLLLRGSGVWVWVVAALLTSASKYLIRWGNKHIFNPSCFGVVTSLYLFQDSWVADAQWGRGYFVAFLIGCLGIALIKKVIRLHLVFAFVLTSFLLFLFNALMMEVPIEYLQDVYLKNGLLLFIFFMITDPMTTPNHRVGRILFGALVGSLWYLLRGETYVIGSIFVSLFVLSPLVPLIDRLWITAKADWKELSGLKPA